LLARPVGTYDPHARLGWLAGHALLSTKNTQGAPTGRSGRERGKYTGHTNRRGAMAAGI
jgi:hypothetical protein